MKKIYTLFAFGAIAFGLNAQTVVTTAPTNRVAILEEFTGTSCPACPSGHTTTSTLLASTPNKAFAVAYAPTNSSLTAPYNGGLDLTDDFPNAFYTNPYYANGGGRSMPSGHMNRIKYAGARKLSTTQWATKAGEVNTLPSPVNVGVKSLYNASSKVLTVTVEMYFTSAVTSPAYLSVLLLENDILTTQSGSSLTNYNHKHVLRENLQTGQWGDALTGSTTAGSLVTMTFTFNNSTTNYMMNNCEVLAFVSTGTDDNSEIITGFGVDANGGSGATASIDDIEESGVLAIYPNPTGDEFQISLGNEVEGTVSIVSISGAEVYKKEFNSVDGSIITLYAKELNLVTGTYIVSVSGQNGLKRTKLIIE
jgi:Outer membrane protein Omp28/Secretion system C-terminal sorting domain